MMQSQNAPIYLLERRLQIAVLIMFMGLSLLGGSSISGSLAGGSKASISSQASEVRLLGFRPDDPLFDRPFYSCEFTARIRCTLTLSRMLVFEHSMLAARSRVRESLGPFATLAA